VPLYKVLHNLQNVLAQIANKMGLQKNHSSNVTMAAVSQLGRLVVGFQPRRPGLHHMVRSCGICGGIGAGFLRVLRFPLPSIPPTVPHSSSSIIIIIDGWYNRPVLASVT
jgi:hypothetical protein